MSYATVEQYEARYGIVSDTAMLQECLDDCTATIDAELDRYGIDYSDPSEDFADRLMRVCRQMANRVMPDEGEDSLPVGITQMSLTTGPYNRQFTFGATYGTPKVIDQELRLLGISGRSVGFASYLGGESPC